jgi:hypothetical protein
MSAPNQNRRRPRGGEDSSPPASDPNDRDLSSSPVRDSAAGSPGAALGRTSATPSSRATSSDDDFDDRFDGEESEGEDLMDADIMRRDYAPVDELDHYEIDEDAEAEDGGLDAVQRRAAEDQMRRRDMLEQMRRSGQRPQMMDDDDEGLQAMLRRGINAQADDDQAAQVPVNLNEIPMGMSLNTFAQQENVRREIR